jgi:hypothetical protein
MVWSGRTLSSGIARWCRCATSAQSDRSAKGRIAFNPALPRHGVSIMAHAGILRGIEDGHDAPMERQGGRGVDCLGESHRDWRVSPLRYFTCEMAVLTVVVGCRRW